MKRAFSKPTATNVEFDTLMTTFRAAGYAGLQLKTGQFFPWLEDIDGYLSQWGDDPGRVSALVFFDTLEEDARNRLARSISLAARAGGERVVFCHDHGREGVDRSQRRAWARELSAIGAEAAEQGIAISLHHHAGHPVMYPSDVDDFFDAVEPGTVRLTVDTAHLAKSGIEDIPGFIRDYRSIIDNIHLKDYADGEWRLLGQGQLDLRGILDALIETQFAEWLCVDEESAADLQTGLTLSRDWLDNNATAR